MERGDKFGQIGYFTSVMLIFIGFAFFGMFLMQNTPLTAQVITNVAAPGGCTDDNIKAVWDSIFWESSTGISIVKNNSVFDGKCVEYFATKHNANEFNDTHILWGYTREVGGINKSSIFAERINITSLYWDGFLLNVTHIENVSTLIPTRDDSFFENYVYQRMEQPVNQTNFNETFEMNLSETWTSEIYSNNLSYSFSNTFSNDTYTKTYGGKISSNYSYALFSFISNSIESECVVTTSNISCGNWLNCSNQTQIRNCINSSNCYNTSYNENRQCGIICTSLWNWSEWSGCIGGLQIRSVWDEHSCGNEVGKPLINQSCSGVEGCISNWNCDDWNPVDCPINGIQKRTCTDDNSCDTNKLTKSETQSCIAKKEINFDWVFILIILVIVGLILGIILFLLKIAKKKEDEKIMDEGAVSTITQPPAQPLTTQKIPIKPALRIPLAKRVVRPIQKIIPQRFAPKTIQKSVVPKSVASVAPKLPAKPVIQKPVQQSMPKLDISAVPTKPVPQQTVQQISPKSVSPKLPAKPEIQKVPVLPTKKLVGK